MAYLRRFTLVHDDTKEDWALKNDFTGKTVRRYDTKDEATAGGVLEKVLGEEGGSVKIQKRNGMYEEERTYPGTKDPYPPKG